MENIDNHEWKQLYKRADFALAVKYNTKPSIIKFIRTSSLKKNWTAEKIAWKISGYLMNKNGKKHHMFGYYQELINFIASLSKNDWEDITRPNGEAIDYMLL